jgi:hypothetical protein
MNDLFGVNQRCRFARYLVAICPVYRKAGRGGQKHRSRMVEILYDSQYARWISVYRTCDQGSIYVDLLTANRKMTLNLEAYPRWHTFLPDKRIQFRVPSHLYAQVGTL